MQRIRRALAPRLGERPLAGEPAHELLLRGSQLEESRHLAPVFREGGEARRVGFQERAQSLGVEVRLDALEDERLHGRDAEGRQVLGHRVEGPERALDLLPLEARDDLLADLTLERLADLGGREDAELHQDLAHAHALVADEALGHAVDHAHVVGLADLAAPQQQPAERLAQGTTFREDDLTPPERDVRPDPRGAHLEDAGLSRGEEADEEAGE